MTLGLGGSAEAGELPLQNLLMSNSDSIFDDTDEE